MRLSGKMAAALRARGPHLSHNRHRLHRRSAPFGLSRAPAGGVFFGQGRQDAGASPGTEMNPDILGLTSDSPSPARGRGMGGGLLSSARPPLPLFPPGRTRIMYARSAAGGGPAAPPLSPS